MSWIINSDRTRDKNLVCVASVKSQLSAPLTECDAGCVQMRVGPLIQQTNPVKRMSDQLQCIWLSWCIVTDVNNSSLFVHYGRCFSEDLISVTVQLDVWIDVNMRKYPPAMEQTQTIVKLNIALICKQWRDNNGSVGRWSVIELILRQCFPLYFLSDWSPALSGAWLPKHDLVSLCGRIWACKTLLRLTPCNTRTLLPVGNAWNTSSGRRSK